MSSRQIFPLFSTPIDVNNLGEFSKPDLRFVEYTHLTPAGESYGFLGSVDKNVLDRPELTEIRALVKNEIEFCAREIYAIAPGVEFYITKQLAALWSPLPAGLRCGRRDRVPQGPAWPARVPAGPRSGNILVQHLQLQGLGNLPKTGDICIFPSYLSHSVQPNDSEQPRWSLAFNVFMRGEFGAIHKLHLK